MFPLRSSILVLLPAITIAVSLASSAQQTTKPASRPVSATTLPSVTFTDSPALDAIKSLLDRSNFSAAADRIDALINDDAEKLLATEGGGLISVAAWIDALPPARRRAVAAASREKFEPIARQRLEALRANPAARREDYYTLARRYRFTPSGSAAYGAAAELSLRAGDLPGAAAFYELAVTGGWLPDEAVSRRIELLQRIVDDGKPFPISEPATQPATLPSSIPGAHVPSRPSSPFAGPIPFDAPWTNLLAGAGQPRLFPFAADDRIFLPSARTVIALRESGQVLWTNVNGSPVAARPGAAPPRKFVVAGAPERIEGFRRPPLFAPALLFDAYGRAQLLVARQLASTARDVDNSFSLRAYRATDGRLLWSTESQPQLKDLNFTGTPAVSGELTYAVALAVTPSADTASLTIVALDTLTGALRWQAILATMSGPRADAAPWDSAWEQSEPCVAADAVYITPNAGLAACIGRFDGKIRWVRPYPTARREPATMRTRDERRAAIDALRDYRQQRSNGDTPDAPPIDPAVSDRFRSTPALSASALIAAPPDALDVFAWDAATGRPLWTSPGDPNAVTLIGVTRATALFTGPTAVAALNPRTGKKVWRYDPPRGSPITGPAVVRDGFVLVPTTSAIITLRAEDGAFSQENLGAPFLRRTLNSDAVKKALEDAGAAAAFGIPSSAK